jgi:hypothetical protein
LIARGLSVPITRALADWCWGVSGAAAWAGPSDSSAAAPANVAVTATRVARRASEWGPAMEAPS